jgi:hypothetical protein
MDFDADHAITHNYSQPFVTVHLLILFLATAELALKVIKYTESLCQ